MSIQSEVEDSGRARAAATLGALSSNFFLGLAVVVIAGVALRLPGLSWLQDVAPRVGFDFHPDVNRFITNAATFATSIPQHGYPLGMVTHLYVLEKVLGKLLGIDVDPVTLIRTVSLFYGAATIAVSGIVARHLINTRVGLLTALFVALSPLHAVNSVFGTADATAVFWFYVALLFGWRYVDARQETDFVAFFAATGVALATKFFIPLLASVGLVLLVSRQRLQHLFLGLLVLAGSFAITSFFNYTPWDLKNLFKILIFDNVVVVGGLGPFEQVWLYTRDSVRSLGIAVWLFAVAGAGFSLPRARAHLKALIAAGPVHKQIKSVLGSPAIVPVSAFAAHAAAIVLAEIHAPRHLLPLVPALCFLGAFGFYRVTGRFNRLWPSLLMLGVVLAYQLYTVVGVVKGFERDIRHQVALEIARLAPEEEVVTFSNYSLVSGVRHATDEEASTLRLDANYFVTCDNEYARYFSADDADKVFHAYGGQERLDFYRDLFGGRLPYKPVFEVSRKPLTFEEYLGDAGILGRLGTFTARHCVLFERSRNRS